jgi:hypothetical protein
MNARLPNGLGRQRGDERPRRTRACAVSACVHWLARLPTLLLFPSLETPALEETVVELGLDSAQARPILGRRLRELDAVSW